MKSPKPTITFLLPDSAGPVMGPVTVLARMLERHYPVQVAAPDFGRGLPPMYRDHFPYTILPGGKGYRLPNYFSEVSRWSRALEGDIIIAVKAVADTIPVALWEKWRRGKKVFAYLDEWDGAVIRQQGSFACAGRMITRPHLVLEEHYYPLVERLLPLCDKVLCTSSWLSRRFNGTIVNVGVDTNEFRPLDPAVRSAKRRELGLDGHELVVFGGVPRPHKGLDQIARAVALSGREQLRLVVVGPETDYLRELLQDPELGKRIIALGPKPKSDMPGFLGIADAVLLPFRDTLLARSQVPCKIFEAMAMGLPLITTAVSDLPEIAAGCGTVVPPDDPAALAGALDEVLSNPARAEAMGRAAREKCVSRYGLAQTEAQLVGLIESVLS